LELLYFKGQRLKPLTVGTRKTFANDLAAGFYPAIVVTVAVVLQPVSNAAASQKQIAG
jgi:hypothetical protein